MGAVYLFHDLYGYLMEMSADIAEMIDGFGDGLDTEETITYYRGKLGEADPRQFVEVLVGHAVLVPPDDDELEGIWAHVPIKGRWNVWQRRGDRLVLWTAWGERPVQQVFLDPEETAMWDAFDGTKRLIEMRHHHDNAKLAALVRRLAHSDVQALKLSVMPWAVYAKRPALAPAYLASTMPYPAWRPGEPVPPPADLTAYHDAITDADAQFEHNETTLSHLLRVPHPVLRGQTYGQALIAALRAKGALPEGRARVLELGAGLGYVARDAIAALGDVDYTIVELSPALAAAQRERVGDAARWVVGDALAVELPAGGFDLVIANEMIGDLPAVQLAAGAAPPRIVDELGITVDDAPDPAYLTTGAFELVRRIAGWLAPGGTAVVTEFGEQALWPRLSTHLDHPELSIHFGQLAQAARASGLTADVEFVIDLLDFDRDQQGLATTRSHFRALRALAAAEGVELAKLGYTPQLLAEAVDGKLDLTTIGELRWDRVEDRLMGLVPHEFKALLARRGR